MIDNHIESQFTEYMIRRKLYMRRYITMKALCLSMGVTQQELTEYIGDELNSSFKKVVNIYRIEEAKDMWEMSGRTSIVEIARTVGCGNSLMFLYHFIREERCLPHVWKRRMLITV